MRARDKTLLGVGSGWAGEEEESMEAEERGGQLDSEEDSDWLVFVINDPDSVANVSRPLSADVSSTPFQTKIRVIISEIISQWSLS